MFLLKMTNIQFHFISPYAECSLTMEDKRLFCFVLCFFSRENEITELRSTLFHTEIYVNITK